MNITVIKDFKKRVTESAALDFHGLEIGEAYEICEGEMLISFYERELEDFFGVCRFQEDDGFSLYSCQEINGSFFATYYRENELVHVYWIECEQELNVVCSVTGGGALPFCEMAEGGEYAPSVTQLWSDKANGMGYVVQLSDGSFIIYDGGYNHHAEHLFDTLAQMSGTHKDIVIRAWIITHSHGDHYPCFVGFADRFAHRVRLETLMISPVNEGDAADKYLNVNVHEDLKKFQGARLLYVHTGMLFAFGDVKLEILFTADELYINEAPRITGINGQKDLNCSSIISRVLTQNKSCIFLGDAYPDEALRTVIYYGRYLESDMCQMSHHGLEKFPLIGYRHINASVLFYPCAQSTYTRDGKELGRYDNVRRALKSSKYTKEIIVHDKTNETRYL